MSEAKSPTRQGTLDSGRLREHSEDWHSTLINSIDAILWEKHGNFSSFTFVSEQAERILGYPVEEWLNQPGFWANHIHPDDREWCVSFCAQETEGNRDHDVEYRMLAADGRVVWLHDRVTVAPGEGETRLLRGITVDISARKEASLRLAQQEEQYRNIFEVTTDGLIITDASTGKVLEMNPSFRQMFRTGNDHPEPSSPGDPLCRGDQRDTSFRIATAFASGRAVHTRADGSTFDAEVLCREFSYDGRPATFSIIRDITEQVRMEQTLEGRVLQRTQEFESLLGVARAVASTLDLRQVVRLVLEELKVVVDYSAASLILIEDDELIVHDLVVDDRYAGKAVPRTGVRFNVEELKNCVHPGGSLASTLDYPCVQVAASRQFWEQMNLARPVLIDDVLKSEDEIAVEYRETMGSLLHTQAFEFIRTWMAVPLIVKGKTIGYIGIASDRTNYFSAKHIRLAKGFADHASTAIENARLYERAQGLAAAEERERLARDLHDSVAQAMYGIALGARTARKYLTEEHEAFEPIEYVVSLAAAGLAEMRALIFDLHPGAIADEGLVRAIRRQVTAVEARHGLQVEWAEMDEPDVDLKVKEAAYSVIREALHNVVKHAQAERVRLLVIPGPSSLSFEVTDDGIGFDTSAAAPGHLGMRSMRERIEQLGGNIDISSAPGRGSTVAGKIPSRL